MDLWLILIVPFLILVAPRLVKPIASLLLRFRNKSEKKSLQVEIVEIRKELSQINQVDQFAKFTRAERKLRAATDKLNSLSRQDLELNIKYALVGQAFVWLVAIVLAFRLVYQVYELALYSLGFNRYREEKTIY